MYVNYGFTAEVRFHGKGNSRGILGQRYRGIVEKFAFLVRSDYTDSFEGSSFLLLFGEHSENVPQIGG